MALFLPNSGKLNLMNWLYNSLFVSTFYAARLYKNNHTPNLADDLTAYTPCDFNGYADQQTTGWSLPSVVNDHAQIDNTTLTWLCTAGGITNQVYGVVYYAWTSLTDLYAVDRFVDSLGNPAPVTIANAGDMIQRRPVFTLTQEG